MTDKDSNKLVKASFKHFDKELLTPETSHCILPISVGQPYHEGKKMEATLELVNKTFKKCTILVCDTLQRYSHFMTSSGKTFEEITEFSRNEGDKWIKRNKKYIKNLTIPCEIQRWDDWLNHKECEKYKQYIEALYNEDKQYRNSVNNSVSAYVERLNRRVMNIQYDASHLSMQYLKEEFAVIAFVMKNEQYNFYAYPTNIDSIKETLEKFEAKKICHRCIFLDIKFHTKNSHQTKVSLEYVINQFPGHIYWKDINGRYLGCNLKQAHSLNIKNAEEMINKTDIDLFGKELAEKIRKNDIEIIKTGKPKLIEEEGLVDGKKTTVISNKSPLLDKEGNIIGILGISIDIKDQKQKENQLKHENEVKTLAIENIITKMPGHVYWKNTEGIFLGCNEKQAQSFGFNSSLEVIGKKDTELQRNNNIAKKIIQHDQEIIKTGITKIIEEPANFQNKDSVFLSHKSPLKDQNGEIIGMVGVSIDITLQKELERHLHQKTQELEDALSEKKRFLNNMSHEIRTPLHVIKAISDELYENIQELSQEEIHSFLETLVENNNRLMNLLTNLLDMAKSQQKKKSYYFSEKNIVDLVKDCTNEVKQTAKVALKTTSDKILVKCDEIKISQVIRNLIDNAIKYGNNTPVTIEIETKKDNVLIKVKDRGVGIPELEKTKIFEPFFQSTRTRKSSGGTGLGLSICKEIILAHNGTIWATTEPENTTCINIEMPYIYD